MRIEKIEFKNIFAYGEKLNTIEYSDKGKLILLKGKSGSGKSAIMSLPILALYGKSDKIPKTAIANRINKNGLIRAYISKNGHEYVIERTYSPSSLKVFKDGSDIENYGSKDAQEYINKEIADIPQTTFTNILAISMKRFKSFLSMSPYDRKTIIDNIFSLEVINDVYEKIKADAKGIGDLLNADNASLFSSTKSLENSVSALNKLNESIKNSENSGVIDENNNKIAKLKESVASDTSTYNALYEKFTQCNSKITYIQDSIRNLDNELVQYQNKLALYNQDRCPTCGASFDSAEYAEIKEKLNLAISEKHHAKEMQTAELEKYNGIKTQINNYLAQINQNARKIQNDINKLVNENNVIIASSNKVAEFNTIKELIEQTRLQIDQTKENIASNTAKFDDLQKLLLVYSIDGIKQRVINNYLPMLNNEIKKNLEYLNFPYRLSFDNKFEPTLIDMDTPIDVATLSDGEMTRVDLVVLCALLKILKFKYPSINTFHLDETLSTLDSEIGFIVLNFLKKFAKEENINIICVSHVDFSAESFDEYIEVKRERGFAEIVKN